MNIDGPTLGRLFHSLAPLVKESSSDFDSKAAAICTSLGLDSVTSEEIVSSFKTQFLAGGSQESSAPGRLPPESGPHTGTIVQPTPATVIPSTPTGSSVPIRSQRAFSSGSRGYTTWYSTESNDFITSPPSTLPTSAGILYLHKNLTCGTTQVWLCDIRRSWINITDAEGVKHPSLADRILLLRSDGLPSWLTATNYAAVQARKEKK
ncbi:hypothetical protein BJ322DRAFT_1111510 [Thelephora terrestris]|uniref:Uncharacterized protein n=1 Tax=Thelephora terrestris TaxID=56493 RepID=A0A9P6H884_9AGAM|nr:hypothetical protein BJ322DRAFT_1111510 [Thelephora terrestris]